jgi:outer membrane lipoprotein SlyB
MKKLLFVFCIFLTGCAGNASNNEYAAEDLAMAAPTVEGRIVSKRPIKVAGKSEVGELAGAAAGGVAGSVIGGASRGHWLGAIGGAVIGGIAGGQIQKSITKQNAFEYIVKFDQPQRITEVAHENETRKNFNIRSGYSKSLITVIQNVPFNIGDRVFVILSSKPRIVGGAG